MNTIFHKSAVGAAVVLALAPFGVFAGTMPSTPPVRVSVRVELHPQGSNSNSGGQTSTNQGIGASGTPGANASASTPGGGNNGGAQAGNGGNGGDGGNASDGGFVHAGSAFTNSQSVNSVNATVVRIQLTRTTL
ncbi:MAG: hypothetical protein RLZZ416_63 [Candidatus Parcubacteria bacterium]|jgi:hypothetical protein